MTTSFTHLGFLWDTTDRYLLLSHTENRINSFIQQGYNLINRGIRRSHPRSIATVIKVQLFPLLYGIELGSFPQSKVSQWKRKIQAILKSLFSCSKFCSNELFTAFDIPTLEDFWTFKNSILCHLVSNNKYTNSILSHRLSLGMNTICKSLPAMTGIKFKPIQYEEGTNGIIDSLRHIAYYRWCEFDSQKQFRDILHSHCTRYLPP